MLPETGKAIKGNWKGKRGGRERRGAEGVEGTRLSTYHFFQQERNNFAAIIE